MTQLMILTGESLKGEQGGWLLTLKAFRKPTAWTEATRRMAPVHLSGTFLISCPKVPPRSRSFHGACSPGHLKELPKGPIKKLISATKAGINCHPIMRAIAPERSSSLPSAHSWELLLVHFSYLLWNESGYVILVEFLLK